MAAGWLDMSEMEHTYEKAINNKYKKVFSTKKTNLTIQMNRIRLVQMTEHLYLLIVVE